MAQPNETEVVIGSRATRPSTLDDRACVEELPPHSAVGGYTWMALLVPVCIVVAIVADSALTGRSPFAFLPIFFGGALVGYLILRWVERRRARNLSLRAERLGRQGDRWGASIATSMVKASKQMPRRGVEAVWREWLAERPPAAIVDHRLAGELAEVPLPDVLLEPEPLNESSRGSLFFVLLMGWFALTNTFNNQGFWWRGLPFWFLMVLLALRTPRIRDSIPILRASGADLVAGPGWVRDRKRRWTVRDSCAIVFATEHSKRRGVFVRLVGPGGVRDIGFESVRNADFRLFWERWMHPHPRVDLEA